ncbi:MAG TPA: transcriptional regulator [Lachnospiraceae bacterium]|jgi:DNA-binding transcriptional MerR regulator|nr:transcriptional regulator [Lachnospiraceae bacterium]HIS62511.1 MerR family transcriptional regulator [Candidatus Scybalomonas excrementigallinarum]
MKERRYMISDASKRLEVEPHVLRYWEEELKMEISRDDMGRRCYSEQDIRVLECVKELKQNGFQLKAIKLMMTDLDFSSEHGIKEILGKKDEWNEKAEQEEEVVIKKSKNTKKVQEKNKELIAIVEPKDLVESVEDGRMDQFQMVMNKIIANALLTNNEILGQAISDHVTERVLKEMDYQFRVQEEQEEQRFKKLDETIRNRQQARLEAAATLEPSKKKMKKKRKRFFLK